MPHGSRAAIMFAVGVSAMAASIPAQGQMLLTNPANDLGRLGWTTPRSLERRPAAPWSAVPAPGAGLLPGGITQLQAMNLLDAAGFANVAPPVPKSNGSWIGYASRRGQRVRV